MEDTVLRLCEVVDELLAIVEAGTKALDEQAENMVGARQAVERLEAKI